MGPPSGPLPGPPLGPAEWGFWGWFGAKYAKIFFGEFSKPPPFPPCASSTWNLRHRDLQIAAAGAKKCPARRFPRDGCPKISREKSARGRIVMVSTVGRDMGTAESRIRSLIREMLILEGVEDVPPPGFARETSHSMGWISPEGKYHFDPRQTDHGDWALRFAKDNPALARELEAAIRPIIEPPGLTPEEREEFKELRKREEDARDRKPGAKRLTWGEMRRIADLREKRAGKPGDPYKDEYKVYQMKVAAKKVLLRAGWGKVSNAYLLELLEPSAPVIETWLKLADRAPGHNPGATHTVWDGHRPGVEPGDWGSMEAWVEDLKKEQISKRRAPGEFSSRSP